MISGCAPVKVSASARLSAACAPLARRLAHAQAAVAVRTAIGRAFGLRSERILPLQHGDRRDEQNVQVEDDRPVLDVMEIVLDAALQFLRRVGFAAPAVDLRPAGY